MLLGKDLRAQGPQFDRGSLPEAILALVIALHNTVIIDILDVSNEWDHNPRVAMPHNDVWPHTLSSIIVLCLRDCGPVMDAASSGDEDKKCELFHWR